MNRLAQVHVHMHSLTDSVIMVSNSVTCIVAKPEWASSFHIQDALCLLGMPAWVIWVFVSQPNTHSTQLMWKAVRLATCSNHQPLTQPSPDTMMCTMRTWSVPVGSGERTCIPDTARPLSHTQTRHACRGVKRITLVTVITLRESLEWYKDSQARPDGV